MKNKNEIEVYFYNEYKEICKKLYIDYTVGLKKKAMQEQHLILAKCNAIESVLYDYIASIFKEYQISIIKIIEIIENEFGKSLNVRFIEKFKEINSNNINKYFQDIKDNIEKVIGYEVSETTKTKLYNLTQKMKNETIEKLIKKNESVKRILKKEKKQESIFNKIKNSVIDNLIGYIIAFIFGYFSANFDKIIKVIEEILK